MPILIGPAGGAGVGGAGVGGAGVGGAGVGTQPGRANAATNTTTNPKTNPNLTFFIFTSFYFVPDLAS
jgi:hypothetical protein